MWPHGRQQPPSQPRGRGTSVSGNYTPNYPLTLGFNQCPQPQQGPQPNFRNQSQFFNPKSNKRERLRPRQLGGSFYSDDSLNSNYSNNTGSSTGLIGGNPNYMNNPGSSRGGNANQAGSSRGINPNYGNNLRGSRGGYSQGGGAIINAAMRNLPGRPPDRRNSNERQMDRVPSRADSHRTERSHSQNKENRSLNSHSRESGAESQNRMYFCTKCGENYSYRHTQNRYSGKIPLILQCDHTMCQECIYQNLKNNKINCSTCQTESVLTQEQTPVCQTDMQNVFPPNFYVIGVISYYRPFGGYLGNLDNIKLVSTNSKKPQTIVDPSDSCCFGSCSKRATMYCPSCEGIFCADCCTVYHKTTTKMMAHEPIPRIKQSFSLMLENCGEHPQMQVEFFCKTCDLTACCYCVLDKHTDHERVPLYHLNETEMEEFKKLKSGAEKALREVLHTQRKVARLTNFNTDSVRKDVCQYFADYHAKGESLEKKMLDELENFKSNNRGLDAVQSSLTSSAEQLKQLVAFNEDKIGDKKLNLRGALEKLRGIDNIPRFLLNENGSSEPVRFVVNADSVEALDDAFLIEKSEDAEYRLLGIKDLPDDYIIDVYESDSEIEGNISAMIEKSNQDEELLNSLTRSGELPKMISVSAANSVSSKRVQRHVQPAEQKKKGLGKDMQRVDVQHINSMDSFYIQHNNMQSRLVQLNKEIETYVKMGGAQPVDQPQLNDLYLAHYVTESQNQKEQRWCRARLIDIKNSESGPLYEMFFIDYGKTQTVDGSRIKDIPTFLANRKPFAVECMLHNPMSVNWSKRAHFSLAKILNGKDVYMIIKALNGGVHEVDLMIASSDGGITSVTDILVHAHQSVDPRSDDNTSLDGSVSRKEGYLPMLRVFPNSKKFTKNQKEKVTIATVVDPDNIFVHLVHLQESFKNMNRAIKKAYKSSKAAACIPIEGTYVLVEHKDMVRLNFHRAFVKSVDLNSDRVHVLLVDWGINVVVPSNSVKPLQESFTRLESQAVHVKMAHISPYNAQATWPSHATNFLHTYHQAQDVLKMVVQDVDNGVQVALFDITGNLDICINAMMVENNLADSTGPISTKLEWPQFQITNPVFSEEEGLMASMLKKVDEEAADDSEEDDCSNVKKRQVDVVKLEAPDHIWVKFLEFRERESEMFKELQIHYSQEQVTKNRWSAGDQCVVEVEHEYVRGKIVEEVDGGDYKVYLYDKAQDLTTPLEKIYVYDIYFMKYPQAVYKSHLANIRPAGDSGMWSKSSVEALQEIFAKHKRIYARKTLESDTELSNKSVPLDMWYAHIIQGGPLDPDRTKYVSINHFLVKLGFAYNVPKPSTSRPSTSAPVKAAENSGEYLLKVLTGGIGKSSEEPIFEDEKKIQVKEVKSRDEEKSKKHKKNANKKKSSGSATEKTEKTTQCTKILESLNKPSKERGNGDTIQNAAAAVVQLANLQLVDDNDNKKETEVPSEPEKTADADAEGAGDGNAKKDWIAIVEEEFGAPKTAEDVARNSEEAETGEVNEVDGSPYHKSEVVIDDWLPPLRLTRKDFKAKVTCVETSGHLFLHDEKVDQVYYKMEANIKEYFDNNPPASDDPQWEWSPGQLCTIKYTDGNWYRGKILKVKNPKEISVLMIDFGSDHDLSPDVLFREVLYTDLGSFATKVKLDKVFPKTGTWLSSDYDHFHELVTDWCRIVVKGPLDVELPLVEVYNDKEIFVNQKLIELCPNLSRCSSIFPIEQGTEDDEMVVIESIESEEPLAHEMLMDKVDKELDKKAAPSDSASKNVKTSKYKKRPIPDDLLAGEKMLLEIGGILNCDKVALKTPGEHVSEEMYYLVIDIQDAVDSLPLLKDFKIGTPCLTPYSEDGVWYRARIAANPAVDLGFVDVIFVDYGNSESVPVDQIRQISPEYLKVPQQTWEAALNFAVKENADGLLVNQVINSLDRKKRIVKVVKEDPLTVDIYDQDDKLSYQSLFDSGYITTIQEDKV